jgi:hypothetical protein
MQQGGRSSTGRAASSNNWRVKREPEEETPREQVHDRLRHHDQRPAPENPEAPVSIAEGRRLYVGNLLYMAKRVDVEGLFDEDKYQV